MRSPLRGAIPAPQVKGCMQKHRPLIQNQFIMGIAALGEMDRLASASESELPYRHAVGMPADEARCCIGELPELF